MYLFILTAQRAVRGYIHSLWTLCDPRRFFLIKFFTYIKKSFKKRIDTKRRVASISRNLKGRKRDGYVRLTDTTIEALSRNGTVL